MPLGREITPGAPKAVEGGEGVELILGHAASSASTAPYLILGLEGGLASQA